MSEFSRVRRGRVEARAGSRFKPPATKATQVAWDEMTSLGVTPAEAFASVAGSCTAPLQWKYVAEGNYSQVEPAAGSTDLTVTVTFDEGSASFVDCADGSFQCTRTSRLTSRTFQGEWDDGTPAALTVSMTGVPEVPCTDPSPLGSRTTLADVRLSYGMDDDRIAPGDIPAHLRIEDTSGGRKWLHDFTAR